MNKSQLLDKRERINREYWKLKIQSEELYRKKQKANNLWKGSRSKLSKISNQILELIRLYEV